MTLMRRTFSNLPTESLKRSLLHRISHDLAILENDEGVRRRKGQRRLARSLDNGNQALEV